MRENAFELVDDDHIRVFKQDRTFRERGVGHLYEYRLKEVEKISREDDSERCDGKKDSDQR